LPPAISPARRYYLLATRSPDWPNCGTCFHFQKAPPRRRTSWWRRFVRNSANFYQSENSGENEANSFAPLNFVKSNLLKAKINLPKNETVRENVSRRQMRDEIVAICYVFC